jgi:type IV pilus assembly protein PilV
MSKWQRGSNLIEVLVTVLVVSIGLLGMASLQLKSMALNLATYQRLQASNLAYEIAESLLLNSLEAKASSYTLAIADTEPKNAAVGSIAELDLLHWLRVVGNNLPEGDLIITAPQDIVGGPITSSAKQYDISVCWTDRHADVATNECGTNLRKGLFKITVGGR